MSHTIDGAQRLNSGWPWNGVGLNEQLGCKPTTEKNMATDKSKHGKYSGVIDVARNGIDEVIRLRAENDRLRVLCDDLYSDILAAASLAPQGTGVYSLLHETIRLRRDRKEQPNKTIQSWRSNCVRQYQQLWERLKAQGKLTISVPPSLQRRVIKAVMKERTSDLVFRYEIGEEDKKCKIRHKISGTFIHFTLEYRLHKDAI